VISSFVGRANARSEHNTAFKSHYVADESNAALVAAVGEMKCYVCHDNNPRDEDGKIDVEDGKKNKEYLNAYGKAMAQVITKDDYEAYKEARNEAPDQKDALKEAFIKKSLEALITVGAAESSPGVTYDELFKQGKMPPQPTE
jgi:hypothetical protein